MQPVADGKVRAGEVADGQVVAKRAGSQFAVEFLAPPVVILRAVDVDGLVGAAVIFGVANKVAGETVRGDLRGASCRAFENAGLLRLVRAGERLLLPNIDTDKLHGGIPFCANYNRGAARQIYRKNP
jgi:hypothetical protein